VIAIIDYGLGNIQAFVNIYRRLNIPVTVAGRRDQLAEAQRLILPGVGSFDWAMGRLNESGMREAVERLVKDEAVPVLGVCVGMQMMARRSDEGNEPGLGWIDAEVRRFDDTGRNGGMRVLPHMGWNNVTPKDAAGLFAELDDKPRYYFLHSYYFEAHREEDILARTDYDGSFTCAIRSGNVHGVQFHPEKSHQWGIQLLKNFATS
jgi:glutamine amidotransferase